MPAYFLLFYNYTNQQKKHKSRYMLCTELLSLTIKTVSCNIQILICVEFDVKI